MLSRVYAARPSADRKAEAGSRRVADADPIRAAPSTPNTSPAATRRDTSVRPRASVTSTHDAASVRSYDRAARAHRSPAAAGSPRRGWSLPPGDASRLGARRATATHRSSTVAASSRRRRRRRVGGTGRSRPAGGDAAAHRRAAAEARVVAPARAIQRAGRKEVHAERRDQDQRGDPEHGAQRQRRAVALNEARRGARETARSGPSPTCSRRCRRRRQQAQHRGGIDLQRAAHGLREGAREGRVGQRIEAVGLEQFELLLRDLDRRRERRDVQALAARAPRAAGGPRSAPSTGRGSAGGLTHRRLPARERLRLARIGEAVAQLGAELVRRPAGCRASSRCAPPARAFARWRRRAGRSRGARRSARARTRRAGTALPRGWSP